MSDAAMKFNKDAQEIINLYFDGDWERLYSAEYKDSFNDLTLRNELYQIIAASYTIGLDLTPEQSFYIWSYISSEYHCSGWMSVPESPAKIADMLKLAFRLLNIKINTD